MTIQEKMAMDKGGGELDDYRISIVLPNGNLISGLIKDMSPISISGSANYGSAESELASMTGSLPGKVIDGVSNLAKKRLPGGAVDMVGSALKGVVKENFINILNSIKQFSGSSSPTFSFEILFIDGYSNKSLKEIYDISMSMVYGSETLGGVGGFINPPFGYTPTYMGNLSLSMADSSVSDTTIQVSVGDWLNLNYLLCSGVNPTFSNIVNENGNPTYLSVEYSFEFYRDPTYEDMTGNFINLGIS